MSNHNATYKASPTSPRRVWFTGLKADNSTANTVDVVKGSVLVRQINGTGPDGTSAGIAYIVPETGYLKEQAVVVIDSKPDNDNGIKGARWVEVCDVDEDIPVLTNANMTAQTTILGLTNGSTALVAINARSDSAANLGTDVYAMLTGAAKAVALETVDTSGTAAVKRVRFGGLNNSQLCG